MSVVDLAEEGAEVAAAAPARGDRAVAALGVEAVAVDGLDAIALDRGDDAVVGVLGEVADVARLGIAGHLRHGAHPRAALPGAGAAAADLDRPGREDAAPADQAVGAGAGRAVVLAVLEVLDDLLGERREPDVEDLGQRLPALAGLLAGVIDPTGAFIGGARRLNFNAELYFPVPGTGNDKSLRIFAFADAGNVWREGEKMDTGSLRASAGIGLSWISPVGPLKLSWGSPLRAQPNDRIQRFQFQIGTAF